MRSLELEAVEVPVDESRVQKPIVKTEATPMCLSPLRKSKRFLLQGVSLVTLYILYMCGVYP